MNHSRIVQRALALAAYSAMALTPAIGNCDAPPPADSLWSQQWNMNNSGQSGGTPGIDIGLLGAWQFTTGSSDVVVAIMRDAAYRFHPDFIPATGSNRISPDADDPAAYTAHGTLIAGIIAAEANNGGAIRRGIAGIDQHCTIWNYLNHEWPVGYRNGDDITHAADAGVDVMNISYAETDEADGYGKALAYAYNRDVVIVAPTGNGGDQQPRFPAAFDGVIAVGGVRDNAQGAVHSNYGPHVDLVAPDANANSQQVHWITSLQPPDGYAQVHYTSYACPHVAGAASLLRGAHPELSNDDIANVLALSAMDVDQPGRDDFTGYGLVKIDSAFRILELPNKLRQWSGGASVHQVTHAGAFVMNLSEGSGVYLGDKYELRRTINFEKRYHHLIGLWTRGSSSLGLKDSSYMYETHHTEIVPGSLTDTSVVLRTYVYELWDVAEEYVGWKPCRPEEAIVSYGILGEERLVTPTLSGTVQTAGHNRISWLDAINFESNWHVDRKEGTSPWQVDYAVLPANSTAFTDSASGLMGSELYEYRIHPSTTNQSGSSSNVVSLRAKPKAPACISGYVVRYNHLAIDPVGYCSAYNTSECRVGVVEDLPLGGGPLRGGSMMQNVADPPPGDGLCEKTNMLVVEWNEPANQVLGAIKGYRIDRFNDEAPPWHTYGHLTTFLADSMCSNLSVESFDLALITVDVYGDTSLRTPYVTLTTGSIDFYGGGGNPQAKPSASTAADAGPLPQVFALHQNHPNPFNAGTFFSYSLEREGLATLAIYDILGRYVKTLVDQVQTAGLHQVAWDGTDSHGEAVASGMYFYRLTAGNQIGSKKMILLK